MVEAIIDARNPRDNALRYWGISVDQIPRGNWVKDKAVISAAKDQNKPWIVDVPVSDGKHIIYFVVSQPNGELGGYDGQIAFGGESYNFEDVDTDTVFGFEVDVKNGKVKSEGKGSTIETELESKSKFDVLGSIKGGLKKAYSAMDNANTKTALIITAVVTGGIGGYAAYKKYSKKSRRF